MAAEKSQKEPEIESPNAGPAQIPREIAEKLIRAPGAAGAKPAEERHFHQREIKQNEWFLFLLKDVTVNDLHDRNFWGGVSMKLRPGDKVCCMSEDRRLYVEVIVFAVGGNWAEVRVLGDPIIVPLSVAAGGPATDYAVKDLGLLKGWGVVELTTGREIKADGSLKSEDQARAWLREFLTMGARRAA